jgi:hypothetical protein
MLGVQSIGSREVVECVDGDPQIRQHTFSPLLGLKWTVFPATHTPTTSTILFFQ